MLFSFCYYFLNNRVRLIRVSNNDRRGIEDTGLRRYLPLEWRMDAQPSVPVLVTCFGRGPGAQAASGTGRYTGLFRGHLLPMS